jgi:acylphosphatase
MSDAKPKSERLCVLIGGYVQGVGFRYFVLNRAAEIGVTGWVRNRMGGQVEVVAEGNRDRLEKLLGQLQIGPRSAQIDNIEVNWEQATGEFHNFNVRMDG